MPLLRLSYIYWLIHFKSGVTYKSVYIKNNSAYNNKKIVLIKKCVIIENVLTINGCVYLCYYASVFILKFSRKRI